VEAIGLPCVVKPVMSSSGKGQSVVRQADEIEAAWDYAQKGGRAAPGSTSAARAASERPTEEGRAGGDQNIESGAREGGPIALSKVIVEGFVDFDYEITLLTVRHRDGTAFCAPIGHRQEDGDYRESWQPQPMSDKALAEAQRQAAAVSNALGGWGVFGMEFFVKGDQVIFSEVSPRPHDTGLVTLISQDLSEFALHARAILGLPIPAIRQFGPSASCAVLVEGEGRAPRYHGVAAALAEPDTQLRVFGKPEVKGRRRMAVTLARDVDVDAARAKAVRAAAQLRVEL
ncbi:MAG: ATP-grasp domain-containing protein, partial [Xanthomonadaceae bacterium]|nr:ATP-grasp domain-containing protein [Xanthomonadaceae bacterium]